jgi:hypothetical protein
MEDVMQLMEMADGLASATVVEMNRVDKCRQDAARVATTLPENPARGSYYWWAKICRQYTGAHFLDSGGAYGYQYQKGVVPEDGSHMRLTIYNGKPEYWNISLPMWLTTMLDASDPIAVAIENVLMWAGEWLYPTETWMDIFKDFPAILRMLYACVQEQKNGRLIFRKALAGMSCDPPMHDIHAWAKKGDVGVPLNAQRMIEWYYDKLTYTHDFKSYQKDLSEYEFIEQALKEIPVKDVKLLFENEVDGSTRGFYTYSHDNDLDQDFTVDVWFGEEYEDEYVILRTHNGADARGGFSEPVVAKICDLDYFQMYNTDGYCSYCHEQYDGMYRYGKEVEKNPPSPPVDAWCGYFAREAEISAGQLSFAEDGWEWMDHIDVARAIVAYMDDVDEDDDEEKLFPIVVCGDGEREWVPEGEGFETIPDNHVAGMYCPKCGTYGVGWHSMVYGF